ncbi:MAG: DoxX family membrane protein [Deltaproteobacteria bacterium]|nr:DoxX family membrane protein [Deltaproteobacteria bacterium]
MKEGLRTILFSKWLYGIVRILLAALFLYGGAVKLMDPKAFARIISSYNLLPEVLLTFAAVDPFSFGRHEGSFIAITYRLTYYLLILLINTSC